jgi:F0F1-type ATP synthase membrane subunit c/vacuolar-type H+-ATPase subunit K
VNDPKVLPKILWGALLFSHGVFYFLATNNLIQVDTTSKARNIGPILIGLASLSALVSYFLNRAANKEEQVQKFMAKFILSVAIAETIHIYGIIAIVLGMSMEMYHSFMLAGIGLHLFYFPRKKFK